MERLLTIREASKVLGVSQSTLRRWDREGRLKPVRVGKHRRYSYQALMELIGQKKESAVAVYARVSSRDQLEDLERQIEYLKSVVQEEGVKIYEVKDVASGIKEGRKGLLKLIELASLGKIRKIYITYPDRLTRFGYDYFVEFFKALGVQVVSVQGKEFKEPEKELVEDLISILTSFAGKLHGMQASVVKRALKELK
ncbi:MAG: IS607 family transposase, partial [Aquificaceae bacterium]|nr:IS607 family transposase [Aquificaceae bacterium]